MPSSGASVAHAEPGLRADSRQAIVPLIRMTRRRRTRPLRSRNDSPDPATAWPPARGWRSRACRRRASASPEVDTVSPPSKLDHLLLASTRASEEGHQGAHDGSAMGSVVREGSPNDCLGLLNAQAAWPVPGDRAMPRECGRGCLSAVGVCEHRAMDNLGAPRRLGALGTEPMAHLLDQSGVDGVGWSPPVHRHGAQRGIAGRGDPAMGSGCQSSNRSSGVRPAPAHRQGRRSGRGSGFDARADAGEAQLDLLDSRRCLHGGSLTPGHKKPV